MTTSVTNTDSRFAAKIFRGRGKAIEFVCDLAPLASRRFDDDGFYWADSGRVSFDELDAAVARAWERTGKPAKKQSAAARIIQRALETT